MPIYPVVQRVQGLKELDNQLRILREHFGIRTGGIVIRGLRAGAKLIRDDAKRRVPHVPSGYGPKMISRGRGRRRRAVAATAADLRQMIVSNIVEHAIPTDAPLAGGKPTVLVRVRNQGYTRTSSGALRFNNPGRSPGYWWLVEFGTSRRPAQPFMRPAFEAQKFAAVDAMKKSIQQELKQIYGAAFKAAA